MRLTLVGFPHTRWDDKTFSHCAFTAKAVRLVEMLTQELSYEVTVLWGGDKPVSSCSSYVPLLSNEEQERFFGYDLVANMLSFDWDPKTPPWRTVNHRTAAWLYNHHDPRDLVLVMSGSNHDELYTEFPHLKWVEPCVGYVGISKATTARCFESYAWMHHIYGKHGINDGIATDTVIPNYQRSDDFYEGADQGYLLYIGRMILRKGVEDAVEIARRVQLPLVMAGQSAAQVDDKLRCSDGTLIDCSDVEVVYVGSVGPVERAELYAGASAVLLPTRYIEPFGTVHIEAMMSGVWPVTTDWGAFTETIPAALRFRTLDQAASAVEWAVQHRHVTRSGDSLRETTIDTFGMKACAYRYGEWLECLSPSVPSA